MVAQRVSSISDSTISSLIRWNIQIWTEKLARYRFDLQLVIHKLSIRLTKS